MQPLHASHPFTYETLSLSEVICRPYKICTYVKNVLSVTENTHYIDQSLAFPG